MRKYKIVMLMTEECILGREYLKQLIEAGIEVDTVVFEVSKLADDNKTYLSNLWYEPPTVKEMLQWPQVRKKPHQILHHVGHSNSDQCCDLLRSLDYDLLVLGGSRILKQKILDTAKVGVLNVHPGMLPKYRGDDIIAWQIFNEDPVGITCHFAVADVDAGPILKQGYLEYSGGPLDKVRMDGFVQSGKMLVDVIQNLEKIVPRPQDESKAHLWHEMDADKRKVVEEILRNV